MMRPMTLAEELEEKLVKLLRAICNTEDADECDKLISEYEYCEAWLANLSVA